MDKTVVKALSLLEVLSASNQSRGVTDLAAEVGLTKANVHRLLRTLLALGYVTQGESDARYRLSLKLWELGARSVHRLDLLDVARDTVRRLSAQADESVQLAIPEGSCMVYVDKAESSHPLRATTRIGSRVPAHCVSSGKAMLAFSDALAARMSYPASRHTARTLTERDEIEKALEEIRRTGYAVNRGEWRDGIWGIAAPVYDAHREAVAAIAVWGPEERFSGAHVERLGQLVLSAAVRISTDLGCSPAPDAARAAGAKKR